MADGLGISEGAVRNADTMLRVSGGRTVLVRTPKPPGAGDAGEEFGLATPEFQDAELGPVSVRVSGAETKLVVAAGAVSAMVGALQFDSAAVLFAQAVGVVIDGVLYAVTAFSEMQAAGVAIAYAVTLRAPVR